MNLFLSDFIPFIQGMIKSKGIWSSLVYGVRLENEYSKRVVSSNLTVPVFIIL